MNIVEDLDMFALQPTCPECGTVLRDVKGGYVCVSCNEAYRFPWVGKATTE